MSQTEPKTWGVRSKIWLEIEGKPIMGEGRKEILEAIEQHGSIMQASRETVFRTEESAAPSRIWNVRWAKHWCGLSGAVIRAAAHR